jgi:CBS domain-containing protein
MRRLEMSPAVSCPPNTSIREIARLMSDQAVGRVVVLDAQAHLAGIVIDRRLAGRGLRARAGYACRRGDDSGLTHPPS